MPSRDYEEFIAAFDPPGARNAALTGNAGAWNKAPGRMSAVGGLTSGGEAGMSTGTSGRALSIRIIWFSMTMAVLIYVLLAWLMQRYGTRPSGSLPPGILQAAIPIAAGATALCLTLAWLMGGR